MDQNNTNQNDNLLQNSPQDPQKKEESSAQENYQDILNKYATEVASKPEAQTTTEDAQPPAQPLVFEPTNDATPQETPSTDSPLAQVAPKEIETEDQVSPDTLAVAPTSDLVPSPQPSEPVTDTTTSPVPEESHLPGNDLSAHQVPVVDQPINEGENAPVEIQPSPPPASNLSDNDTPPTPTGNSADLPSFDLESSPLPARHDQPSANPPENDTLPPDNNTPPPVSNVPPLSPPPNDNNKPPSGGGFFKALFFLSLFVFLSVAAANIYSLATNQAIPIPFLNFLGQEKQEEVIEVPIPTDTPLLEQNKSCLLNGTEYTIGQSFIAADGCNTCTCDESSEIVCTEMACDDQLVIQDDTSESQATDAATQQQIEQIIEE